MAPMVDDFKSVQPPQEILQMILDPSKKRDALTKAIESLVADMYESSAQSPDKEIVAQSIKEYVHSNLLSVPKRIVRPRCC